MENGFCTYPNQQPQSSGFEQTLHALRARQDEILRAIGDRTVEITTGLIDELAGLDLILEIGRASCRERV